MFKGFIDYIIAYSVRDLTYFTLIMFTKLSFLPREQRWGDLVTNAERRRISTSLLASMLLCVSGCAAPMEEGGGGRLVRSVGGEPSGVDSQAVEDSFSYELLRDLSEGLTAESPSGETVPGVASNWTVSPDGLRYDFTLRPTARWSNGDTVTAEEFVASLRRAADPGTGSPGAELLTVIRGAPAVLSGVAPVSSLGVRADGPGRLIIELAAPAPYFPAILANAVAYPLHHGQPPTPGVRAGLVSNGAYQLAEWIPGASITLERNPRYWDAAAVAVPTVVYVPIHDSNAELARYRAGQLDITSSVPAGALDALRTAAPDELQIRSQLAVVYYAFNLARPPFAGQPGLREALELAVDRDALTAKVLRAGQVPAYGFVPPAMPGYSGASMAWRSQPREAQLRQARALYAAAGYGAGRPLRLRLLHPEEDTLNRVAIAVASMWQEALGVETTLVGLEYRAFLAARADRSGWEVLSHGWNADYPDPGNFLSIFTSGHAQNDAGLSDAPFDALMRSAAGQADSARRLELLTQAEARLLQTHAVAPLYFAVTRRLVKPTVAGAVLSPMNHNYSKYLSLRPQRSSQPP
jgi:oligopeptide transport system substrate-binding protein